MELLNQSVMRCWIVRSEQTQLLAGFVTGWRLRNVTVLVTPRAGLRIDEAVLLDIEIEAGSYGTCLGSAARLLSRVVSLVWQESGDLVGLAVLPEDAAMALNFKHLLVNRSCSQTVC